MGKYSYKPLLVMLTVLLLAGCHHFKDNLNDEVVLKNENSVTGTIIHCDSTQVKIQRIDESMEVIRWTDIDTIRGKKLKSLFFGMNLGYYKMPYYSVFLNEPHAAEGIGFQYRLGYTFRGNKLGYFTLTYQNGRPYEVTKVGFGFQKYIRKTGYQSTNAFYFGGEAGAMNAKNNNGAQFALDPFFGYERLITEQIRVNARFGLQLNPSNKNKSNGANLTIGFTFIRKNFKYRYDILNTERRIYKR